jgi:hypothetical protein
MAAKPLILNKDQVSPLASQLPHLGARTDWLAGRIPGIAE